jgi:ankyrin repeat protein
MPNTINVMPFYSKARDNQAIQSQLFALNPKFALYYKIVRNNPAELMSFILSQSDSERKTELVDLFLEPFFKPGVNEEDKKAAVSSLLYFYTVAISEDLGKQFKFVIGKYGKYIDFNSSYKGNFEDFYIGHGNNLITCLIYHENYQSLKEVLKLGIKRGEILQEIHKDLHGKSDLAILIINQSPFDVIQSYIKISGLDKNPEKINFFEKQGGYSLVEYMLYLGRYDVLQIFQNEIKRQLAANPEYQKQIDLFHSLDNQSILETTNRIFLDNGMVFSTEENAMIQPTPRINRPLDRPLGLDYPMRATASTTIPAVKRDLAPESDASQFVIQVEDMLTNTDGRDDINLRERLCVLVFQNLRNKKIDLNMDPLGGVRYGAPSHYPPHLRSLTRGQYVESGLDRSRALLPTASKEHIFLRAISLIRKSNLKELTNLVFLNPWLIEYRNKDGNTALHFCTNSFKVTIGVFKEIIADDKKRKAMVEDVLLKRVDIAKMLLRMLIERNIDFDIRSNLKAGVGIKEGEQGDTPEDILNRIKSMPENQVFANELLKIIEDARKLKKSHDAFIKAANLVRKSNLEELRNFLDDNPGIINYRNFNGNTLLHICTNSFNITKGAFSDEESDKQEQKTADAISRRGDVMKLLIEKGGIDKLKVQSNVMEGRLVEPEKGDTALTIIARIRSNPKSAHDTILANRLSEVINSFDIPDMKLKSPSAKQSVIDGNSL